MLQIYLKMGRKKLEPKSISDINNTVIRMFVPQNILQDFEVWDIYGKLGNWIIELREKEDKIPKRDF